MEVIASRFYTLYEDIRDVWMLGKWLAWPFYYLSSYFNNARDKCWEADQDLVFAITWVKGLIEGNLIADILERIWYEFTLLRNDPVGWVKAKIDQVSGELRYLRLDPLGWIQSRLYFAFPIFYTLLGNSGWWIYSKLNERYPEVGSFIRDTWGYLKSRIINIFFWARELDINPSTAVIGWINNRIGWFWSFVNSPSVFVYERLKRRNYDINLLLTNPIQWVKEKVGFVLGMNTYEMDNFTVSIIKRMFSAILSNQAGLIEYVRHTVCELILRYI
jgi:hypothetical protein